MILLRKTVKETWMTKKSTRKQIKKDEDWDNEIPDLDKLIPKLETEYKLVNWACSIYAIAHNNKATNNLAKQAESHKFWDNIELEYHQISIELDKELDWRLEALRVKLGYEDKDKLKPWRELLDSQGGSQWKSHVEYGFLYK
jgi:hypothetical protein